MQVTETLSEGLKRAYTVVVPAADIETKRAARLANLGKTLNLPGFRPGKIPPTVVRQRFGTAVNAEVLEESVTEATQQVLTERGLRPALQPKIDVVSLDPSGSAGKDLEFKVELELLPEITLPDFGAIQLTRMKVEAAAETVDKALAGHRPAQPHARGDPAGGARRPRRGEGRGADRRLRRADRRDRVSRRHRQGHRGGDRRHRLHSGLQRAARGHEAGRDPHDRGHLPGRVRRADPGRQGGELRGHRADAEPRGGAGARRRAGEEAGLRRSGGDAGDGQPAVSRRSTTRSPGCG